MQGLHPAAQFFFLQMPSMVSRESMDARQQGTAHFQAGNYAKALFCYLEAHEADKSDTIAASNASESALRLKKYGLAYSLAMTAYSLDPTHAKTWFRIVRSLALMNQSAKAHIFVADLESASADERVKLHQAIAEDSPTCAMLRDGLLVERIGASQYAVFSRVGIPRGALVLKETPFLPWSKLELQDDMAMAAFMRCPDEHVDRTDGLFPRSVEDFPTDFGLFTDLRERVRTLLPDATDAAVERRMVGLARCKMCAFESGLHHFAALIDHSCAPNCEVAQTRPPSRSSR